MREYATLTNPAGSTTGCPETPRARTLAPMLVQVFWLLAGLVLLLTGGEALVRGASSLARRLGISPTVIGLTVVAFGTSAPELAVSVLGATSGTGDIAFGNVVGSNIANVGFLLGVTALMTRLTVHSDIVSREVPMLLVASTALCVVASDGLIDGAATDVVSRADGLVLLLLFSIFLYYTARSTLSGRRRDSLLEEAADEAPGKVAEESLRVASILVGYGLLGLALGGDLLVDAASTIARALGAPEVVIGMTIVAIGTSLPELFASIAAARQGHRDVVIGNIVGSNLTNIMLVLGLVALISPLPIPPELFHSSLILFGLTSALFVGLMVAGRSISRALGFVFLLTFALYLVLSLSGEGGF